ncbi:uncharacterized protein A1O5_09738 [Cladophialophora psammophila CBS 110553]|uniref:Uncharacterized protein n=1 Tax=Cladophialophora psammophila CBS 110553 TaxID=1182543 RepID=W9WG45_9EURO|nr:uncharacterized protein A1O5_09738 [Cladophialophora psammophila CBS 110553]EXJ67092.1 hypothetical protein A1O5_09738 [Cladophialophora psammophila CBS 110553]
MVRHTFETARVGDLSTYEGLNTARGRARFIVLVVDYMTYLKSDPAARPDWDETEGRQTASAFLKLINNDRAWPFARQVVRDFQSPV